MNEASVYRINHDPEFCGCMLCCILPRVTGIVISFAIVVRCTDTEVDVFVSECVQWAELFFDINDGLNSLGNYVQGGSLFRKSAGMTKDLQLSSYYFDL